MDHSSLSLPRLNFSEYEFSISSGEKGFVIFDPARRKKVKLTPEEWVRQHIVRFLMHEKKTPVSLIGVEKSLKIGRMQKRFDIVVFTKQFKPLLLIECKAPDVMLDVNVLNQVARYNSVLKAKYFMLTNGLNTIQFYFNYPDNKFVFINNLPDYSEMLA